MRSAARPKVQTPELRLQGVQGIESSSEDDAGGVKDTGLRAISPEVMILYRKLSVTW